MYELRTNLLPYFPHSTRALSLNILLCMLGSFHTRSHTKPHETHGAQSVPHQAGGAHFFPALGSSSEMQGVDFQPLDSEPWCVSARQIAAMEATTSLIASIAAGLTVFSIPHRLYVSIAGQSMGRVVDTRVPVVRAPSTKIWHHAQAPTRIHHHVDSNVVGRTRMDVNHLTTQVCVAIVRYNGVLATRVG